jgi:formamidopyrimidine-DNA glycosylase
MSGALSLVKAATPLVPHDHVDFALEGDEILRLNDPRRFGALLWSPEAAATVQQRHPLLAHLGPEPLGTHFDAGYLAAAAHGRHAPIKVLIMDQRVVVGVGNIYASEALFRAGIHPARAAGRISSTRLDRLTYAIKETLSEAIAAGGTTLRDYRLPDGEIGAYQDATLVYARAGLPCTLCAKPVSLLRQGGRATYYCARCQR